MVIGAPKEIKPGEQRVALTPAGARALTEAGHHVLVELGRKDAALMLDSIKDPERDYFDARSIYTALPKALIPPVPYASFVLDESDHHGAGAEVSLLAVSDQHCSIESRQQVSEMLCLCFFHKSDPG